MTEEFVIAVDEITTVSILCARCGAEAIIPVEQDKTGPLRCDCGQRFSYQNTEYGPVSQLINSLIDVSKSPNKLRFRVVREPRSGTVTPVSMSEVESA
jgi:DNA-directed RNA polymerase subunit RPC12/RpoP